MQSQIIPNGKHAVVLGAGASGAACARFLLSRGWSVTVADTRNDPPVAELRRIAEGNPSLQLAFGGMPESLVTDETELLVISPGLSPFYSSAAPLVHKADEQGIDVVGEIELFARELARLKKFRHYDPIVIGITGTNGKTTTTTMVGLMAAAGGRSVCVAGNIGPNALTELDKLNVADKLPSVWVLELSSFQLETTRSLACTAAAFLNLTEDHTDWHGSIEAYAQAKARIFAERTARVINRDDPVTASYDTTRHDEAPIENLDAQAALQQIKTQLKKAAAEMSGVAELVETESFGDSLPTEPGQWGIAVDGGLEWLARIERRSAAGGRTSKKSIFAPEPEAVQLLMPVQGLHIHGRHNAMNALAALALIDAAGLPLAPALGVLKTYRGEAHRVQEVLRVKGRIFIDDSKGTNVGAVIAALTGLGKTGIRSSIVLGGDGKGQDFAPLADAVRQYACSVVTIGRDGEKIGKALEAAGVPVAGCGTDFELAVRKAWEAAQEGDAVLLSPACASWDMFKDYAERSALFVSVAKKIAQEVAGCEEVAACSEKTDDATSGTTGVSETSGGQS